MANDNQRGRLDIALSAMRDSSVESSEEAIIKIITSLEEEFGDNQKTIAEELQKLARQIEHTGRPDMAMEFKQRTTSAMLRLNMERRRGLRPPAITPAATIETPPPVSTGSSASISRGSLDSSQDGGAARSSQVSSAPAVSARTAERVGQHGTQVEYLVHPSRDVRADVRAFCDILKGQKVWESGGGNMCAVRFPFGPQVLIVEELAFTCSAILSVTNFERHADDLEAQGYQIVGSLTTPSGSASVFASDCGSKFALMARA